tara:strand:- start:2348 stop:2593 length:246 start_codon:yes stop_codon:yes gene_type:complete
VGNDDEHTRFEIGDIVRENDVIAWYDDEPMIGIVIGVTRNFYAFYYDSDGSFSQDRVTVLWLRDVMVEALPSDLVHIVSKV